MESRKCLSAPIEVSLYLTSKCNLMCSFCYYKSKLNTFKSLSIEKWKNIIFQLKKEGVLYLSLLGGEPTLYSHIDELLLYLEYLGFNTTITTNGYNIKDSTIEIISRSKFIMPSFSIQTLEESNSTELTGVNTTKIITNIKKMIEAGKIPRLNTVITNQSYNEITELIRYADSINIKELNFNMYQVFDKSNLLKYDFKDYRKLFERLNQYIIESKINIEIDLQGCMLYSAYPEHESPIEEEYDYFLYGCEAGKSKIEIMPNGDVYPCAAFEEGMGEFKNFLDYDIMEIWYNDKNISNIRNLKTNDLNCQSCNYNDFCRGGCPVSNIINNNSLNLKGDIRCQIQN